MAQLPSAAQSRYSGLYAWLTDRERRALAAGGTLPHGDGQPSWDGTREQLAALGRGETVDLPLYGLPAWARVGEPLHWRRRAVVSADGAVTFRDDDGSVWLAENGCSLLSACPQWSTVCPRWARLLPVTPDDDHAKAFRHRGLRRS